MTLRLDAWHPVRTSASPRCMRHDRMAESGNPDTSRRGVSSPDPARLERAATLTMRRAGRTLTG